MREAKTLFGVLNPLGDIPCFAIPVFNEGGHLYSQLIDDQWQIKGFAEIAVDETIICRNLSEAIHNVGDPALCAFYFSASDVFFGTSEELAAKLRVVHHQFESRPFLLLEIANFLGDTKLQVDAMSKVSALVGELNPKAEVRLETIVSEPQLNGPRTATKVISIASELKAEADPKSIDPKVLRKQVEEILNLADTEGERSFANGFEKVFRTLQDNRELDTMFQAIAQSRPTDSEMLLEVAIGALDDADYMIYVPQLPSPPGAPKRSTALFQGHGKSLACSNALVIEMLTRRQDGDDLWLNMKWPKDSGSLLEEASRTLAEMQK